MEGRRTTPMDRESNSNVVEVPKDTLNELVKVLGGMKANEVDTVEAHQKALDDLVNVNSLFTIAVFIGLSYAAPNQHSLDERPQCDADPGLAKKLVVYEVFSFSCFLLSSLVAKSLKVLLNIRRREHFDRDHLFIPDKLFQKWLLSEKWKRSLMAISILSSLVGIWFLTFSMVNVIQIKVGKLTCGSTYAFSAVIPLSVVVLASQLIYAPSMMYGVFVTATDVEESGQSEQA